MRPLVRPVFAAALAGAVIGSAWVWCLRAMIATLPVEHGPAHVAAMPTVEEISGPVEAAVEAPAAIVPPPFKVKWKPRAADGPRAGEFGPRPSGRGEFGGDR